MTDLLDAFGHVGYTLLGIGMLLIAQGKALGWAFRLAGELIWLVIGLYLNMSSMWIWGGLFLVIDLFGLVNAKRKSNA